MPRAKAVAGKAKAKPAEVPQDAQPVAPAAPLVPEGSVRVLGFPSNGEPVLEHAPAKPQPVEEMVPVMVMPSGDAGSFVTGFQRNPQYPDPALAPAKAATASPWDPRQGVRIIGASPSVAQQKVNVLF